MFIIRANLLDYLDKKFDHLECQDDTRAYISSIFKRYVSAEYDFSQKSITLLYADAREKQDFAGFQNLGDWLFFSESLFPESLNAASEEYYRTIARSSYYRCYTLINRKWRLFEEISDNYSVLINQTRSIIKTE